MLAVVLNAEPAIFLCLLAVSTFVVMMFGGTAERLGIGIIFVGSFATAWAMRGQVWTDGEVGIFMVDVVVLAAFMLVMVSSRRFWPLWITGLQIVAVATHLARFVRPKTVPMAYAVAEQLWGYVMIAILVGCVMSRRSKRASAG